MRFQTIISSLQFKSISVIIVLCGGSCVITSLFNQLNAQIDCSRNVKTYIKIYIKMFVHVSL